MAYVPMNRVRALLICTHPKDYALMRVREAAKHLLARARSSSANKALEGPKR